VAVTGTLREMRWRLVSADKKYDKECLITGETEVEDTSQKSFDLVNFNGSQKARRSFFAKTAKDAARWKAALFAAIERKETLETATSPKSRRKPRRKLRTATSVLIRDAFQGVWVTPTKEQRCESWRESKLARERLTRAIDRVVKDVADTRRKRVGYTAFELATLRSELEQLRTESRRKLKWKIRRVIRAFREQQRGAKFQSAAVARAEQHGLLLTGSKKAPHHSFDAPEKYHSHDVASIVTTLPALLQRNKVLPYLANTLKHLAARSPLTLEDAVTCLLVGTVMETLLNLPGGLSVLLSLPRERFAFKKLCCAALLCQVPLFTTRIVEMLAALAVLPEKEAHVEGYRLARTVLADLDTFSAWHADACVRDVPLKPSREARSTSGPPPYASLAQILLDRDAAPELRVGVASLFTALCASVHRSQSRDNALWLQVQIFYALRVVDDGRPFGSAEEADTAAVVATRRATTTTVRRRSETNAERAEGGSSLCAPLVSVLADAANCEREAEDEEDRRKASLLRISVERFLDSWDARELDEAEELDFLERTPGNSARVEIFVSRIRRAALLLAHHDVDDLLEKLGEELEGASATAIDRHRGDDALLHLNVHSTADAVARLQHSLGSAPRPVRPKSMKAVEAAVALQKGASKTLKDHPEFGKFFKMVRMHVPKMAVALKMSAEGLDPAILDEDPNEPYAESPKKAPPVEAEAPALREDPRYAKYFKMLRMHVPLAAVQQKMEADGHDPKVLDAEQPPPPPVVKKEEGVVLEDDPRYGKYFKMLRMHVPPMAVEAKLVAEGLDPAVLKSDPEKVAAIPPTVPVKAKEDEKTPPPVPLLCARPPAEKVRRVFFDLLTDGAGTFYDQTKSKQQLDTAALAELERVFQVPARKGSLASEDAKAAAQAAVSDLAQSEVEATKKKAKLRSVAAEALGPKRAFALNLMFGSLKVSSADVAAALTSLDGDDATLKGEKNVAQLSVLYNILADESEIKSVERCFSESSSSSSPSGEKLDEISRFFFDVKDVPRKRAKVVTLWLASTLEDRVDELQTTIDAYATAATLVNAAGHLQTLLLFTLALSNFANFGTARANVAGVKVSSLLKLITTKTTVTSPYRNLLTFAAKFADVPASALRVQLPADVLAAAFTASPRSDLKNLIRSFRSELDTAVVERQELERAGNTAAAAVAADIVDSARPKLEQLQASFDAMEDAVDQMLSYYGESPTADVSEFFHTVDRAVRLYEEEYYDFRDALDRQKRREELQLKRQQRCHELEQMHHHKSVARQVSFKVTAADDALAAQKKTGALSAALKRVASGRALEFQDLPDLKTYAQAKLSKLRATHHTDFDDDDNDFDDDDFDSANAPQ